MSLRALVLLQVVYGGEQSLSWEAESCRSAVGLEDEFTVHVLGSKHNFSVLRGVPFPLGYDGLVFLSCQYLGCALGCWGARCSEHECKGLLLILGICHPCGKGVSCDSLLTDGLREMTGNFLGITQENKPYVPQLGKEHNFP